MTTKTGLPGSWRRLGIAALVTACVLGSPVTLPGSQAAGAASGPAGQYEPVPAGERASGDQLPAARMLIAAYAFVWVALLGYLWLIWRRLDRVEREMKALEVRTAETRRPHAAAPGPPPAAR